MAAQRPASVHCVAICRLEVMIKMIGCVKLSDGLAVRLDALCRWYDVDANEMVAALLKDAYAEMWKDVKKDRFYEYWEE